jgi:hypothetical protein
MKMPEIFTRVVAAFQQQPDITKMGFLSSFFVSPPDAFTDADTISLDIVRSGEEIAPSIQDLSTGAVSIVEDKFTEKEVPFPVYALDSPVTINQLMKRQPGESAIVTEKVNWLGRLARILIPKFAKMTGMIRRSMELQAAQVLQTGTIVLTDENGKNTYLLNLNPKATHFPTVTTTWGAAGADPMKDIDALADVIRDDGQCDVVTLIFGKDAWDGFIKNSWVQENLKQDVLNLGALDPQIVGKGAKRMGFINSGSNRYDLYLYNGRYNPFGSTEVKKFLDDDHVIFLPATSDLDFRRYFGGIPTIIGDPVSEELFGGQVQIGNEYDFRPRIYSDVKRETWVGEIKSRPLHLPVSIDRFGCLTTSA